MLNWLSTDGKLIIINRSLRSFAFGFMSVIIGIYLSDSGIRETTIGLLLSASIIGGALFTIFTGKYAGRYGIKKMILISMILSIIGILGFILSKNIILLFLASMIAFISPSGKELGPFLSLEQAYLPETVSQENRTKTFSYFNMAANLATTFGSLLAGLPVFLQNIWNIEKMESYRVLFLIYLIINIIALLIYTRISEIKLHQEEIKITE